MSNPWDRFLRRLKGKQESEDAEPVQPAGGARDNARRAAARPEYGGALDSLTDPEESSRPKIFASELESDREATNPRIIKSAAQRDTLMREIHSLFDPERRVSESSRRPVQHDEEQDILSLEAIERMVVNNETKDPLDIFNGDPDSISTMCLDTNDDPLDAITSGITRESPADAGGDVPAGTGLAALDDGTAGEPESDSAVINAAGAPEASPKMDEKDAAFIDRERDREVYQSLQTRIAGLLDRLNSGLGLQGSMIYTSDGLMISLGAIPTTAEAGRVALEEAATAVKNASLLRLGAPARITFVDHNGDKVVCYPLAPHPLHAVLMVWTAKQVPDQEIIDAAGARIMEHLEAWLTHTTGTG